jgi:hypothetical protein
LFRFNDNTTYAYIDEKGSTVSAIGTPSWSLSYGYSGAFFFNATSFLTINNPKTSNIIFIIFSLQWRRIIFFFILGLLEYTI